MKKHTFIQTIQTSVLTLFMLISTHSFSAGYLKIGDIKGESTDRAEPEETLKAKPKQEKPASLLLPAIQNARSVEKEAPPRTRKGKVEATWKVEEGEK